MELESIGEETKPETLEIICTKKYLVSLVQRITFLEQLHRRAITIFANGYSAYSGLRFFVFYRIVNHL